MISVPTPKKDLNNTQNKIIDAAILCVKRWGVEKVNLNDIAKEAGVTRPTVYSYFSNRDEIIQQALLQSAYLFGAKAIKHLQKFETARERTIEAVIYSLKKLPKEPSLALLKNTDMSNIINNNGLSTPEGQQILRGIFQIILIEKSFDDDELDEIAEVTARFLLSLLTIKSPKKRNDKELRSFIERRLLPSLGI
jgi:AcrR family transcriptional regulator